MNTSLNELVSRISKLAPMVAHKDFGDLGVDQIVAIMEKAGAPTTYAAPEVDRILRGMVQGEIALRKALRRAS